VDDGAGMMGGMSADGREWVERLPAELDGQRALLRGQPFRWPWAAS
jgi:hypothetical protein